MVSTDTQIFDGVPDVHAQVLQTAVDGDTVWTEWETSGTRDRGALLLRGVIIFRITQERIRSARFFLEPVDEGADGVTGAVGRAVGTIGMEAS